MQFVALQRTMAVNCWLFVNSFVLLAFVLLATTHVANASPAPSLAPGTLKEVLKNFKNGNNNNNKASRSLRVPMDEDVSMDLFEYSTHSQREQALKMCRSPQVRRDADLSTQWWNDDLSKSLTCQMGRHVTKVHVPDVQRANSSHRMSVLRSLNWAASGSATVAKKFGNSVAEGMGYKDFDHWSSDWGQVRLPCLPPPESEEYVNNVSRLTALKSLATFWHGNLQSYFLFFAMAGNTKEVTGRFADGAREYSCRLHEVLSYVRNLLVQLNMRPAFKVVTPPSMQCMEKKCSYAVDHFQRLAIGVRDSMALLLDIQRHVDAFRVRYDDEDS